jgi:uncharacterized RDD family membrane protein YckC
MPARPTAETPRPHEGVLPRRLAAWAVDAAIQTVLAWLLLGSSTLLGLFTFGLLWGLLLPWMMALPILYGTLAIASPLSATPGQALLGLVVRSELDGGHPTLGQAFASTSLFALSWASGGMVLLAALFSARGRTLHDLFSGTVVVRAEAVRQGAADWDAARAELADG